MNAVTQEQKFSIFMPVDVKKSIEQTNSSPSDDSWLICGFASTAKRDFQGESVQPSGINIDYFIRYGWINYEHQKDVEYQIGIPTENCYVDIEKGFYVEAKLIKDNKYAQQMWKLANDIKKSGLNRNIGFSIEGKINSRDPSDESIITDILITNVALTTHPANPEATWDIALKSWETGHGITPETQTGAGALRKEDFAKAITTLSYLYKVEDEETLDNLWKSIGAVFDDLGRYDKDTMLIMLQLGRGLSKQDAYTYLNNREE